MDYRRFNLILFAIIATGVLAISFGALGASVACYYRIDDLENTVYMLQQQIGIVDGEAEAFRCRCQEKLPLAPPDYTNPPDMRPEELPEPCKCQGNVGKDCKCKQCTCGKHAALPSKESVASPESHGSFLLPYGFWNRYSEPKPDDPIAMSSNEIIYAQPYATGESAVDEKYRDKIHPMGPHPFILAGSVWRWEFLSDGKLIYRQLKGKQPPMTKAFAPAEK